MNWLIVGVVLLSCGAGLLLLAACMRSAQISRSEDE